MDVDKLNLIKDAYHIAIDLIDRAINKYKNDKVKTIKLTQIKRHFNEWHDQRKERYVRDKVAVDEDFNRRNIYMSGFHKQAIDSLTISLKKDIESKRADVEDEIKLVELS